MNKFVLMVDRVELHLMHEACALVADPPVHSAWTSKQWVSVAPVTEVPRHLQSLFQCAWCQRDLDKQPDPALLNNDVAH